MSDPKASSPIRPVVLVTGMSGAGLSTALKVFEDLGYEAVDNLRLGLVEELVDVATDARALAVAIDTRNANFSVPDLLALYQKFLPREDIAPRLIFLECSDESLQQRFTETRRRHPLAFDRTVADGIKREREMLWSVHDIADKVIDTSNFSVHDLRRLISGNFELDLASSLSVFVTSFARIAIGHIAADRSHITHLRIRNLQGCFTNDGSRLEQCLIGNQFVLCHHGADADGVAADVDTAQSINVLQVHKMWNIGHAQLHHRDQAVTAGHHARIIAMGGKQFNRFRQIRRAIIFKSTRYHFCFLLRPVVFSDRASSKAQLLNNKIAEARLDARLNRQFARSAKCQHEMRMCGKNLQIQQIAQGADL